MVCQRSCTVRGNLIHRLKDSSTWYTYDQQACPDNDTVTTGGILRIPRGARGPVKVVQDLHTHYGIGAQWAERQVRMIRRWRSGV
jgi:hypothetical protein